MLFNLGEILHSVSHAIDLASSEIAGHQQRTAYTAYKICIRMGVPDDGKKELYKASLLHDIGAITISEKIAHCIDRRSFLRKGIVSGASFC